MCNNVGRSSRCTATNTCSRFSEPIDAGEADIYICIVQDRRILVSFVQSIRTGDHNVTHDTIHPYRNNDFVSLPNCWHWGMETL
jgi:hypothetical protein